MIFTSPSPADDRKTRGVMPRSVACTLKLIAGEIAVRRTRLRDSQLDRIRQYLVPFAYRAIGAACLLFASATGLWAHSAPPVLTAVTPNPLTVGEVTVTITGTGFTSGMMVYNSYGNQSMIQSNASQITATSVTLSIYQGPATTSTFCVGTSASTCSNSITVPVTSQSTGSGSGGSNSSGGSSSPPIITSVSPNPLPVANNKVTITGTGFTSGMMVYNSYGSQSMIQSNASQITPTSVTLTIYQGPATTSTFCVGAGASKCSNSITVPVTSQSSSSGSSGSTGSGNSPTAPVITSVSPNPLPVANNTVTITGTGFASGMMVYNSYGGQSMIQSNASQITPTSVTLTIYQGPATTSTFCVGTGASNCSNSITVPVSGPPANPSYTLTVANGTIAGGGTTGSYTAGSSVSIVANTPPVGEAFQSWTGAQVANPLSSSTTITMPSNNAMITANYYTPTPVPFPVASHPRLWLTQEDLPRLQSWALESNPAYQGLTGPLYTALGNYQSAFPPGPNQSLTNPIPASPYPDFGDVQGYTGMIFHSFSIPAFRIKREVIPGRYTTVWFEATTPGTYHLFCTQYCGKDHSRMGGDVVVQTPEEYRKWLAGSTSGASLAQNGERLFASLHCNACHNAQATARGPNLVNVYGSKLTLSNGQTITADDAYLRQSILNPSQHVTQGYAPIMPTYQGQISEEGVFTLLEYIRNLDSGYRLQQTLTTTDLPPESESKTPPTAKSPASNEVKP